MSTAESEPAQSRAAQALVDALRQLHGAAGEPSARAISKKIGTASHTTVAEVLRGKRIPSWPIVASIVRELSGDETEFRQLWMAAADRLPAEVVPRQLPRGVPSFVGRLETL